MEAVLTTFLAPLLSYLLRKGERVGEEAIDAVGRGAWDRAKTIWAKVWPRLEAHEAAREAVDATAEHPDDEAARGALQFQLRKLLEADPALADELAQMLRDAQQAGVIADNGAVVIGGDVRADRGGVAGGRDVHGGEGGIHTHWQEPPKNR